MTTSHAKNAGPAGEQEGDQADDQRGEPAGDQGAALDGTAPIASQLHDILREQIIHNDLKPGHRLSESHIARRYAVSRQPVRECFIKLAAQGLVTVLPQRGTIVNRIDHDAVLDARFVREAIEAEIMRLLLSAPDADAIAGAVEELRRQIARQTEVEDDANAFIALDEQFHRTLAEAAGKGRAWALVQGLKSQMDRVRFLSFAHFPIRRLIRQHQAIVDCIEAGDATRADAAIRAHLREILKDMPEIRRANAEYFHPSTAPAAGGRIDAP